MLRGELTSLVDAFLRLAVRAPLHDAILSYIFNTRFIAEPSRLRGAGSG